MSEMSLKRVYLDHNATTPIDGEMVQYIQSLLPYWANPSSIYGSSRLPKQILRETRRKMAEGINCHPLELIFTSGGSESNNLALKGLLTQLKEQGKDTIITSTIEHPSVTNTVKALKSWGWKVFFVPVNRSGELDIAFLEETLKNNKVGLVSIMAANNETGVIHPIKPLAALAHKHGALFHCDAVQFFGKVPVDIKDLNVDLASFSAHKFYSLKGCGVLYCRKGLNLESLIHGGGQERSRRAGTENVLAIASFGHMLTHLPQMKNCSERLKGLRDYFEKVVVEKIQDVEITAAKQNRLNNTTHLVIKDVDGENLLINLDLKGFEVSTGAACSSGSPEPSPVLLAMGLTRAEAQSSLRVSFGKDNTQEDVDQFIAVLIEIVEKLRSLKA